MQPNQQPFVINSQPRRPGWGLFLLTALIVILVAGALAYFITQKQVGEETPIFTELTVPFSSQAPNTANKGCVASGCSGQLCVDEGNQVMTTCEYRAEFACYKAARCERQPNGSCAWTPTEELIACIETSRANGSVDQPQ